MRAEDLPSEANSAPPRRPVRQVNDLAWKQGSRCEGGRHNVGTPSLAPREQLGRHLHPLVVVVDPRWRHEERNDPPEHAGEHAKAGHG